MKFTIERLVLMRMLKAVGRRAPLRGRPKKMVWLSASDARVFVEGNGKAAGTEALVLAEGGCVVDRKWFLYILRSHTRGRTNVTFMADPCFFYLDRGGYPLGEFSTKAAPPAEFQEFPFVQSRRRRNRKR